MNDPTNATNDVPVPRGWHWRGYLPHFDGGAIPQSVTFRLADSFPKVCLDAWRAELRQLTRAKADVEMRRRIEGYLDAGHGACHLRDPRVADLVQNALLYFDGTRYRLHAWVIMPNHVHVLFTPVEGESLSAIVHSWKSYTAKEANRLLGRQGQFWEEDYFDRFIRNEEHFAAVAAYIESNPVKAGLCGCNEEWRYSSAGYRAGDSNRAAAGTAALPPAGSTTMPAANRSAAVPAAYPPNPIVNGDES
jgi:REP element-mobilizing transposase RayT